MALDLQAAKLPLVCQQALARCGWPSISKRLNYSNSGWLLVARCGWPSISKRLNLAGTMADSGGVLRLALDLQAAKLRSSTGIVTSQLRLALDLQAAKLIHQIHHRNEMLRLALDLQAAKLDRGRWRR